MRQPALHSPIVPLHRTGAGRPTPCGDGNPTWIRSATVPNIYFDVCGCLPLVAIGRISHVFMRDETTDGTPPGGSVIRAAVVALCLVFMALPTARAMDIPIVYLTRAEDPRLPLSFVDPIVEDPGVWGARLALADNSTTGGFLGHKYELVETVVPEDGDIATAFTEHVDAGRRLFIADL